jgi:RNA polymerase sigma factor (sigma-70 family)
MQRIAGDDHASATSRVSMAADVFSRTYLQRVHRFAVLVSPPGTDPEDVAQDAMVSALAQLDRYDSSRGSVDAWLWRIVVNRGRDAGRVARRIELLVERLATLGRPDHSAEVSPESLALDRIRDEELIAAVRRLPRRYRTLIALRYGAGRSSPEISEMLGMTRMAVVKATRRALDRLRNELEVSE